MTTFPGSPKVMRGAIVTVRDNRLPQVILFQYNPASLSRSLSVQDGENTSPRIGMAPSETINVTIEIDAADALEDGDKKAVEMGILPQLSALEVTLYPEINDVLSNETLLNLGIIELIPPPKPLTLFLYGVKRILPVGISSIVISEDAHDAKLNPIRAQVQLSMSVLSYNQLKGGQAGYSLFVAHQKAKETMAALVQLNSLGATGYPNL
jgi:hypothetical protein